jgi:hypothetical protein
MLCSRAVGHGPGFDARRLWRVTCSACCCFPSLSLSLLCWQPAAPACTRVVGVAGKAKPPEVLFSCCAVGVPNGSEAVNLSFANLLQSQLTGGSLRRCYTWGQSPASQLPPSRSSGLAKAAAVVGMCPPSEQGPAMQGCGWLQAKSECVCVRVCYPSPSARTLFQEGTTACSCVRPLSIACVCAIGSSPRFGCRLGGPSWALVAIKTWLQRPVRMRHSMNAWARFCGSNRACRVLAPVCRFVQHGLCCSSSCHCLLQHS